MPPLVSFRGVTVERGGTRLLAELSLDVEPGERLVLLGRSGAGKTTALKLVNALLLPSRGEVIVEGRATTAWDPIALRRRIGYVIQEVGLLPHLTAKENVCLVPRISGWEEARAAARADELLEAVGLAPAIFGPRRPRELSGGERQRVGVARALAADPDLLLFDEPFGALDPVTRLGLQTLLLSLSKRLGKTILFVTHDVREALLLGTRIALLSRGRLAALGAPDAFLASNDEEARAFRACLEPVPA
jgi:osmoprotectant transport system ATP-binding protein